MMRSVAFIGIVLFCRWTDAQVLISGVVDADATEEMAFGRVYVVAEFPESKRLDGVLSCKLDQDRRFKIEIHSPGPRSVRLFLEISGAQRACVTNLGTGGSQEIRIALQQLNTDAGKAQATDAFLFATQTAVLFAESEMDTSYFGVQYSKERGFATAGSAGALFDQLIAVQKRGVLPIVGLSLPEQRRPIWEDMVKTIYMTNAIDFEESKAKLRLETNLFKDK